MSRELILASASQIRHALLAAAGIAAQAVPARIDEPALIAALAAEGAPPRDVADTLAEMKAAQVMRKHPQALVLGCDQVLEFNGRILQKPADLPAARAQLAELRGQSHHLFSALVLYEEGRPIWRHVEKATLRMRDFSDSYLNAYLARNWPAIGSSVGSYQLEAEGIRLFAEIRGDHFAILGLPLLPLIGYLAGRGFIAT